MMGAISGIAVSLFGVFWVIMAISGGAWFMAPFGIIFVVLSVVRTVYNFKNATGKNRYSEYDITEQNEEPDPLNERFGESSNSEESLPNADESKFCPFCGARLGANYEFCNICGKKLP